MGAAPRGAAFLTLTVAATISLVAAAGCAGISSVPLGLDPVVPIPLDNPPSAAKLELGERLFFDPILSADGTRTCSSCHDPRRGFGGTTRVSLGIRDQPTRRNAPPLINRAWGRSFFRDGRASSLEAAVLQPVVNAAELGLALPELEQRLRGSADYRELFREAFGASTAGPTSSQAAAALATFIRSLMSGNAPFDRYSRGDSSALTSLQKDGRELFFGKARCSSCHVAPTFTDEGFHNTGVAVRSGDRGRAAATGLTEHVGAFRTPTLRNVELTAPYMHDGSLATLEEVIDFYDRGGEPNPNLDPLIRPIRLSARERAALAAFLRALNAD